MISQTQFFHFLLLQTFVSAWIKENCSLSNLNQTLPTQPDQVHFNFSEFFTSIELSNSTDAKALDGSNYKFYFTPGQGSDSDKFMIHWQGGKFCGYEGLPILDSCYTRLFTRFGSGNDTFWAANGTQTVEYSPSGALSSMEEYNPLFWKWNKVKLLPLDGANFQGYLKEPLEYNGSKMWFRGFNNTMASFDYLRDNYDLFNASEIILSGGSTGGIAAMIWSIYLKDYLPKKIKIKIYIDGSLFLDAFNEETHCYLFRFMMQSLAEIIQLNASELYGNCQYKDEDFWKCLMIKYIYKAIDYPVFISNAQTDVSELVELMSITCFLAGGPEFCNNSDRKRIEKVRELFLTEAMKMKKQKPNWGFFLRSCFEHSLNFSWAWYGHSMDVFNAENQRISNLRNALYGWYLEKEDLNHFIDLIDWLHNPRCVYLLE